MKKLIYFFVLILGISFLNSCKEKCDKDCGPCGVLDEENCECIYDYECLCNNGQQDPGEAWIDCGGDHCPPCTCEYEPCTFLCGGDVKTWQFVSAIDPGGNPYEPDECDKDWTYKFQVNHVVEMGCPGDEYVLMIWTFDEDDTPSGLFFTDGLGNQYKNKLYKLTADTLILEETIGTSTYIVKK